MFRCCDVMAITNDTRIVSMEKNAYGKLCLTQGLVSLCFAL